MKSERINIHELTVDEPERQSELLFDPERDLTKEDWQMIKDDLEKSRRVEDWASFLSTAVHIKILNPQFDLGIDQKAWEGMRNMLNAWKENATFENRWEVFLSRSADMKILDPTLDLNLDQADWQRIRDILKKTVIWDIFSRRAVEVRLLDHDYDLNLDQNDWRDIQDTLKKYRRDKNWGYFCSHAANVKILDSKIDLGLDKEAWQGMRDKLEWYRERCKNGNESLGVFSDHAREMKILAAEEVKVTDKGLEINMRKDKKDTLSDVLPMPEAKQF